MAHENGKPVIKNPGLTTRQKVYYTAGLLAALLYLYLSFFAPQNPSSNAFDLSPAQRFFLRLTILIPYIATWVFGVFGLAALDRYVALTKGSNDVLGSLLRSLRTGFTWIIAGTISVALVGAIRSYVVPDNDTLPLFTIISNYLHVFPPLIGFLIIYRGAINLRSRPEMSEYKHGGHVPSTAIVLFISAFYIFLISTNPTRQALQGSGAATYYLPDVIIGLTIVLPILVTWWIGFSVAFLMSDLVPYFTRPEIYKGITRILYGIWSIIFSSIIIQALVSLGAERLLELGLGGLLLVIYLFVFVQGLGYFLVAFGSRVLQRSVSEANA